MPFVLSLSSSSTPNLLGQRPTQLKGLSHPRAQKNHTSTSKFAGSVSEVGLGDVEGEIYLCFASGGRRTVDDAGDVLLFEVSLEILRPRFACAGSVAAANARRPAKEAARVVNLIVMGTVGEQERVGEEL